VAYHNPRPDFANEIRDLKKRLRILENAGLGNISVGGGGISVGDGGRVVFGAGSEFQILAPDGTPIVHAGALPNGDYGFEVYRQTGGIALRVSKATEDDTEQTFALYDKTGSVIVADAQNATDGADAPFIGYDFRPVTSLEERTTSSSTFTDLFAFRGAKHNAFILPTLQVRCSDGTTSGQVRIVNRLAADAVLAGHLQPQWTGTVALGTTTDTELAPTYGLLVPGPAGADVHLVVQAKRTAGAGSLAVAVVEAHGVTI
jgi:hypothetical protein